MLGALPAAAGTIGLPLPTITELAKDAWIYGFAPVTVAEKNFNQTIPTADAVYAPINQLFIDTATPLPDNQLWVSPNVNVVYASSHIDLTNQPLILFNPDRSGTPFADQYFVWQFMDAYTNDYDYVGSRTTGQGEGTYAIVGPNFNGTIPFPVTKTITSPTNSGWIVGRFEVTPNSTSDRDEVVDLIQKNVFLTLNEYQSFIIDGNDPDYENTIITKPGIEFPELNVEGLEFFNVLNRWLVKNPPPALDDPILGQIAQIGISPVESEQIEFDAQFIIDNFDEAAALLLGIKEAEEIAAIKTIEPDQAYCVGSDVPFDNCSEDEKLLINDVQNGWFYSLGTPFGNFEEEYLPRTLLARGGLGGNIVKEAVYPVRFFDENDQLLSPTKQYTFTFEAGFDPVNDPGFWSITLYDLETGEIVANPLDRYTIGSQNDLITNQDGSITIYIQRDNPGGDKTNNWLPTAASGNDPFYLLFRAYNPKEGFYTPVSRTQDTEITLPNIQTEPVPEPLTLLGTTTAIIFGASFKQRLNRNSK